MTAKLEREMLNFRSFIKDEGLREKFNEIYNQVIEENKDNVVAFIPVGNVERETLDIGDLEIFEDYEIRSGERKTPWGDEIDSESEYEEYLAKKADEEFASWTVIEVDGEWQLLEDPDDRENVYNTYKSDLDAKAELDELKEDWIESQTEWDELDIDYHEVYWNYTWRFNGDLDREVADRVGLGYLEHLSSGDEYLFLLGCGQDNTPKLIAYQALAFGYIEDQYTRYFDGKMADWSKYVMGQTIWEEVLEKLNIQRFFKQEVTD